jgi:hypothetical protein
VSYSSASVLRHLEPVALQISLRKFFRWLYPHGKLFVSTFAPSGSVLRFPRWHAHASVRLLDELVLRRELTAAGFVIEKLSCSALAWDTEHVCANVIARCGP